MALPSPKGGLTFGEQRGPIPPRLLTFILSMEASILNCCTVLLAWAMLLVLAVLLDIFNYCFYLKPEKNIND